MHLTPRILEFSQKLYSLFISHQWLPQLPQYVLLKKSHPSKLLIFIEFLWIYLLMGWGSLHCGVSGVSFCCRTPTSFLIRDLTLLVLWCRRPWRSAIMTCRNMCWVIQMAGNSHSRGRYSGAYLNLWVQWEYWKRHLWVGMAARVVVSWNCLVNQQAWVWAWHLHQMFTSDESWMTSIVAPHGCSISDGE